VSAAGFELACLMLWGCSVRHYVSCSQLVPSIDLRQRAPVGVQGDLSIRGSTFGQALVLLRMDDVQTGHYDMDLPLHKAPPR
jgi:hypothetical protein